MRRAGSPDSPTAILGLRAPAHDRVLRAAIEARGGSLSRHPGGVCAEFATRSTWIRDEM